MRSISKLPTGKNSEWKLLIDKGYREELASLVVGLGISRAICFDQVWREAICNSVPCSHGSQEVECRRTTNRESPALTNDGRAMILQLMASCRFRMTTGACRMATPGKEYVWISSARFVEVTVWVINHSCGGELSSVAWRSSNSISIRWIRVCDLAS